MTLLKQAIAFRKAFNQPINEGFAPNGFINQREFAIKGELATDGDTITDGVVTGVVAFENNRSIGVRVFNDFFNDIGRLTTRGMCGHAGVIRLESITAKQCIPV